MYKQGYERQDYNAILLDADIRKKQELQRIKRQCCGNCTNCGIGCLKLEHTVQNSKEIYYCGNFKQKESKEEKSFRKDINKQMKSW